MLTYYDYSERLKEVAEKKSILEKRIADAKKEIPEIEQALSKTTEGNQTKALTARLHELHVSTSTTNSEIWQMGDPADMQRHVDGIARRKAVEKRLIGAIKKDAVRHWLFPGYLSHGDLGPWKKEKGYGYSIELSTVWWHPRRFNLRRQSVRIYRAPFDAWLAAEFPEKREPTLEERAMHYAVEYAKSAPQKVKQRDTIEHLRAQFPGLTLRAAEEVWKHIPKELKLRGAPMKTGKK